MFERKKGVVLVAGPSNLREFVEVAIGYQTRSLEGFQNWLSENPDLEESHEIKEYSRKAIVLVKERIDCLELAQDSLNSGFSELAEKELENEILLHENLIKAQCELGENSKNEHLVVSNIVLVGLQQLQDDIKGTERETYGVDISLA